MINLRLLLIVVILLYPEQKSFAGWTEQNSGVTTFLYDVCFIDSMHGWAVGDSSTIISTVDGGDTWVKQDCPKGYNISKIYFLDENNGFAAGKSIDKSPAVILKTVDGGESWQIKNTGIDDFCKITNLTVIDKNRIWVTGNSSNTFPGYMIYSSDGGDTWEYFGKMDTWENEIYFVSQDTIYTWSAGDFSKSTNSGLKWSRISTPSAFQTAKFINGNTFWIYCLRTLLRYTDDGGQTFKDVNYYDKTVQFWEMSATNNEVWLVGAGGKVVRYTTYETVSVNKSEENCPYEIILAQNSPNPFNPITTISYSIVVPGNVKLDVYNIAGQKIATLINSKISAGNHTVSFDGSSLASGVYLYRFEAGKFNKTGKMLLVK